MKLKLAVEYTFTGPLHHKPTVALLEDAVAASTSLEQATQRIEQIHGLATYCGGSHVAVHPTWRGQFANGSERLAIVTEEPACP